MGQDMGQGEQMYYQGLCSRQQQVGKEVCNSLSLISVHNVFTKSSPALASPPDGHKAQSTLQGGNKGMAVSIYFANAI